MSRRIGFRVDAGATLGGGHVMRCLTLAGVFRSVGHSCIFLSSPETLEVIPKDMWNGFTVRTLDGGEMGEAADCFDLLVIDHYGIAAPDETRWRTWAGTLLVIDDLADRPHDCDFLLDQTYGVRETDYEGLVPGGCRLLLGTEYALLRSEFAEHRLGSLVRREDPKPIRKILVSLGLTDLGGVTGRICDILKDFSFIDRFDVVIGSKAASRERIEDLVSADDRFRIHCDVTNMADLMMTADAAIGAGGTSTWERCALGLPTVLLVLADNQFKIAEQLDAAGVVALVGDVRTVRDRDLSEAISSRLRDFQEMARKGARGATLCDGDGATRVVSLLEQHAQVDGGV
ncbi:UDP-2,4-diacetamido-2,4,6-trideoxy-beta-L-altropyranose hydrolase [uncultured Roseibium sp.]|uniref:UDP-2,4-diacetamido-2,4, 6-trideoxy-beta-L-altropyranose hydrolase n=1 Tax=uncultured Roseibium sp. TaxID=1936171 RepID=UPI00262CFD9C|nr:UDP-2,4-diacetamido-2,4,6-trideoxy-beta-L-altropyranose hydrolase [uncultured Roseibium sp.]